MDPNNETDILLRYQSRGLREGGGVGHQAWGLFSGLKSNVMFDFHDSAPVIAEGSPVIAEGSVAKFRRIVQKEHCNRSTTKTFPDAFVHPHRQLLFKLMEFPLFTGFPLSRYDTFAV